MLCFSEKYTIMPKNISLNYYDNPSFVECMPGVFDAKSNYRYDSVFIQIWDSPEDEFLDISFIHCYRLTITINDNISINRIIVRNSYAFRIVINIPQDSDSLLYKRLIRLYPRELEKGPILEGIEFPPPLASFHATPEELNPPVCVKSTRKV
jgi:hypothetical protein